MVSLAKAVRREISFMKYSVKLPRRCDKDLAYICGLITGDGSMPNAHCTRPNGELQKRHLIYMFSTSEQFLKEVYIPLFFGLFGVSPKIKFQHKRNKVLYNCRIESMDIYSFLEANGMKTGKKAKVASVPKMVRNHRRHFLAGLLDTDGGKKGSGFGLSTASAELADFCISMFKEFGLSHHSCPWLHNGHVYHQIYVHKKDIPKILKYVPLKNKEKIDFINATVAQPVER